VTFRVHRHEIERTVGGSFSFFLRFSFVFSEQASTRDIYSFDQLLVSHRPSLPSISSLFISCFFAIYFYPPLFLCRFFYSHTFPHCPPPPLQYFISYLSISLKLSRIRLSQLFILLYCLFAHSNFLHLFTPFPHS